MGLLERYELMKHAEQEVEVTDEEMKVASERMDILAKYAEVADEALKAEFGEDYELTDVEKLAEMLTEITKAQLLVWRLGQLMDKGLATPAQISMAKRNSVEVALNVAREARQIHGGMGITGEFPMMRHMMNLESVVTYEGTHDIHLLILGADITGINAFS